MPEKTIRLPVLRVVCGFWYALLVFSAVPGLLSPQHCHAGPRLNVTAPGAGFSVDLAIADAIILR